MVESLRQTYPVARKEHKCMYCNCTIPVGTKYMRNTCKYEGMLYDWINHTECEEVAQKLNMYDSDYDGLDDTRFQETMDEYLSENYYDETIDDIPESIDNLSRFDQVKLILEDYDKPRFKAKRLKEQIAYYEMRLKMNISLYENERISKCLEERKKELENLKVAE